MFFDDHAQHLTLEECQALLASASVGRVSTTLRALPVVVPVNYGYLGGSIILAMGAGPTQRAISGGNIIGFGVDNAHRPEPFWGLLIIGRANEILDPDACADYQRLGLTAPSAKPASPTHYLQLMPDIILGHGTPTG